MSSLHNDLATWAAKANAQGREKIEITTGLAGALSEVVRLAGTVSDGRVGAELIKALGKAVVRAEGER